MALPVRENLRQLIHANSLPSIPVTVALAATIFILTVYLALSFRSKTAYENFPFVGRDAQTKTQWQLKMRWVKQAKSLIYDTLAKVGSVRQFEMSDGLTNSSRTNHSSLLPVPVH